MKDWQLFVLAICIAVLVMYLYMVYLNVFRCYQTQVINSFCDNWWVIR